MRAVIQRVRRGRVSVGDKTVGEIGSGFVILLGVGHGDGPTEANRLAAKIANLRIFADAEGKTNVSLLDVGGEALIISQFTLYADCRKGRRPSFVHAAPPDLAAPLVESFAGELRRGACTGNSTEMNQIIANFLGVELGSQEKQVARLACAGGSNVARRHGDYRGVESCRAAALVSGGGKGCAWGCLGLADCERVCDFDAIVMDRHDLPQVIDDLCTACGDCVDICPRDLFSLQPVSHRLWVACKNLEKGEAAEDECVVACNGCGRCAADAPGDMITMENNLAVVDYSQNALASRVAIERCPTGAIVWLEGGVHKGQGAVKIIRKEALPLE